MVRMERTKMSLETSERTELREDSRETREDSERRETETVRLHLFEATDTAFGKGKDMHLPINKYLTHAFI